MTPSEGRRCGFFIAKCLLLAYEKFSHRIVVNDVSAELCGTDTASSIKPRALLMAQLFKIVSSMNAVNIHNFVQMETVSSERVGSSTVSVIGFHL